jgi:hypothetical protein
MPSNDSGLKENLIMSATFSLLRLCNISYSNVPDISGKSGRKFPSPLTRNVGAS